MGDRRSRAPHLGLDAALPGDAFGWHADDFNAPQRAALAADFCDDATRDRRAARHDPNGAPQ
ncbi:hypothetical protein CCR87_13030 [Rhodobaculum claviforme]|uniref:Uncharacterized protein n=1 Tax=Rhodobaculum claviforme TaxID=1549854 RepID=A0A934WII4_9RHOB|nr:hypothetical protein [Rhodobaculum claviforme]